MSLAQVLLDPAARTRAGMAALVQREWLVMGHPFASRANISRGEGLRRSRGRGLVFMQVHHSHELVDHLNDIN